MTLSFTLSMTAGLALFCSLASRANEIFPSIHNEPITVQVLSGKDGKPVPHAHLLVVAGYDQEDLRLRLWQNEILTDAEGKVLLSKPVGNLPLLQVWVTKAPLCQESPRKTSFSVEEIRRDGLSTPNRCGIATVTDRAGIFTVFVKPGKNLLSPDRKDVLAFKVPAPATTPALPTTAMRSDSPIANPPDSSSKPALPPVFALPSPKAEQKPVETAGTGSASAPAKEVETKPSSFEAGSVPKSPIALKRASAGRGKALNHASSAKRRRRTTQAAAAQPNGTGIPKPVSPPSKATSSLPKKATNAPGLVSKPAAAATVQSRPAGPPPTAPKIAVNLETAPPAVRPVSLESAPRSKPAAGRDLEQPLAESRVRRRIKNPKDAAAAAAAVAARAKASAPVQAPTTAATGAPAAVATPVEKPAVTPVPPPADSPANKEAKKE